MTTSFWYGVFWPYFQFFVFIAFIVYVARKPINNFLESKRSAFKTKLSEAHEALVLAERKIKKYESQIASLTKDVDTIKTQQLQTIALESEKILQDANKTAESILNDAKRIAHEFISQTQDELKEEIFKLALAEFQKRLTADNLSKIEHKLQDEALLSIPQALSTHK